MFKTKLNSNYSCHASSVTVLTLNLVLLIFTSGCTIYIENMSCDPEGEDSVVSLLEANSPHRTYLITYSQLNHRIFPTRLSFAVAVVQAFGAENVDYYTVSKEPHVTTGYHYHMAVRLSKPMRWKTAKDYIVANFGIIVHFSTSGHMYAGAYRYAIKHDTQYVSGNVQQKHPNLDMLSAQWCQAIAANSSFRENASKRRAAADNASPGPSAPKKKKSSSDRIKKGDVAVYCIKNNLRNELQLVKAATERRDAGDRALYDFLISLSRKSRVELVEDAWRFETAKDKIEEEDCDRMKKLVDAQASDCTCQGLWMTLAKDIMDKNKIDHQSFATAIANSLMKGRHKDHNILLHGPGDSGKSFILKPILKVLPLVFKNPANSKYAWMGAEKSNLIFLNDLRWAPLEKKEGFIAWSKFLNLLEGFEEQLPAAMNQQSTMVTIKKKMPIWATSDGPILYWVFNRHEPVTPQHVRENDMMRLRWNTFEFTHVVPKNEKVDCEDCVHCFAKFVLDFANIDQ